MSPVCRRRAITAVLAVPKAVARRAALAAATTESPRTETGDWKSWSPRKRCRTRGKGPDGAAPSFHLGCFLGLRIPLRAPVGRRPVR